MYMLPIPFSGLISHPARGVVGARWTTVKTKGACPARRVYDLEIDEWVAGQL